MENTRTDRIAVRFIPHRYEDGTGWLGIESTDGSVLPSSADSFFLLDLRPGMTYQDAKRLADVLNEHVQAFGQSRTMPPASDALM
jgi:hypothetical protein